MYTYLLKVSSRGNKFIHIYIVLFNLGGFFSSYVSDENENTFPYVLIYILSVYI